MSHTWKDLVAANDRSALNTTREIGVNDPICGSIDENQHVPLISEGVQVSHRRALDANKRTE